MAAFNFPNSPSTNDLHTENGVTFKWNGTIWLRVGTNDKIEEGNTAVETVDTGSNGHITFDTEGTERLRINSSGQVSIGNNPTVAADAALHIELDGTREYLRLEGDGGTSNAYIELEAPDNRRKAIIFKSGGTRRGVIGVGDSDEATNATSLFFSASANIAGNSPHMVIDSSGRMGLGIANPSNTLSVVGSDTPPVYIGGANPGIKFEDTNASGTPLSYIYASDGQLSIRADDGNETASSLIEFKVDGSEKLRITSAGVVSINDSTPEAFAALQVKNHTGYNAAQFLLHGADMAQIILRDETGGSNTKCTTIRNDQGAFLIGTHNDSYGGFSEKLRITSAGLIGIGEINPTVSMHLKRDQTSNHYLRVENINSNSNYTAISLKTPQLDFQIWNQGPGGAGYGGSNSVNFYQGAATGPYCFFHGTDERLRIDSTGRVLIGSTAKAGDSALQVYTADRKHPAIRTNSPNANGYTLLSDAYTADESQVNIGVSYSSASLVLGFGCKVSDSADNAFLSSQDTYSTRPCALKMGTEGDFRFYTTETNATTTTDSAVSLTEVFSIDRVGNIRQKITDRHMYFGANQALKIGVVSSDPVIDALAGDLQVKNSGATLFVGRSDHTQFYQNIKMNNGKGIDFSAHGNAGGMSSELLDAYEEGSFTPTYGPGSVSYSDQYGFYIRVGNMVHCWFDFTVTACSGQSGVPYIGGFPFSKYTRVGGSAYYYEGITWWFLDKNFTSSQPCAQGYFSNGNSTINMYYGATPMIHGGPSGGHFVNNQTGRLSGQVNYTAQ